MLENLHVKNLALIEEEEIEFGKGFNILTGETGAGKSIILGSINLALGAKLSSDVIRKGADNALIELTFSLTEDEKNRINDLGYDTSSNEILIQRKILPNKSVCRINGETVSLSDLRTVADIILEIYGQHDNQSLLKASTYEKMLDDYTGNKVAELKKKLKELRKEYKELLDEYNSLNTDESIRKRQADLLQYEINEIISSNLKEGEDEELEQRYRFLNNARKIEESVIEAHTLTGYDSNVSAGSLIGNALSKIKGIGSLDENAEDLVEELSQIESLLNDFNRNLSSYKDTLSFDDAEFLEVEQRLNLINDLKAKYDSDIKRIISLTESKQEELDKLNDYENHIKILTDKIDKANDAIMACCKKISELRKENAKPLEKELINAMSDLNFLNINLKINVNENPDSVTDSGFNSIEFLISLNAGEDLKPMQTVASGGELSRIMLAVKSIFANKDDVSTLIFDEIDSGISGRTAYKVAEKMEELSRKHQLICITHLPQIAAMADRHYLIEKQALEGRTYTGIDLLDEEASINELARMLGGDVINDAALENARQLKKSAIL